MKLAFCTDGVFPLAVGGMQRHSKLLLEALSAYEELDITVFHPHKEKLFASFGNIKEVEIEGIDESGNYLKECFGYSKRIYAHLNAESFDVIYSQGLSVWYKAEQFSDRLVVNPHGLEPYQAIGLKARIIAIPFKRVFNRIFNKSKYVVSLGGGLTTILKKHVAHDKLVVLPNAVNLPVECKQAFPDTKQPVKLLFMARFAKNKGIHVLMEAADQLNNEGYSDAFTFHLGGKGPLYDHYRETNSHKNVVLHGFIDDDLMHETYLSSDVFVLPTLFEGMPTVVLEAMSMGLPIIVTDVGATAELVDTSNGYLIEKNQVEALKLAILSIYELSTNEKKALGNRSRKKVEEQFTWPIVAQQHYALFQKIAASTTR